MTTTLLMQRRDLVELAATSGIGFAELCRRFGISAKTGYKWRKRWREGGEEALKDRSRRPKTQPAKSEAEVEGKVVALRREHPAWGGRKLRRRLQDVGEKQVPAASTCTQIVRRHGLPIREAQNHTAWERFERTHPNELWQMDFKGPFPTLDGKRCHPLTLLDDHSRYNVALEACADERGQTVREHLSAAFRRHGLPSAILCDNGAPWGDDSAPYTALGVWLLRLGVRVMHGRPYHPQTQGKDERFHRTLKAELIDGRGWSDLAECAERFPRFRHVYNHERPHDALGGATPSTRYRPSPRTMPEAPLPLEYAQADTVKRVRDTGIFSFLGQTWQVGRAFAGLSIGLRPSAQADGQWDVFFGSVRLGRLDLTSEPSTKHQLRSIYTPKTPD